jgi:hypothetical protein
MSIQNILTESRSLIAAGQYPTPRLTPLLLAGCKRPHIKGISHCSHNLAAAVNGQGYWLHFGQQFQGTILKGAQQENSWAPALELQGLQLSPAPPIKSRCKKHMVPWQKCGGQDLPMHTHHMHMHA